MAVESFGSLSFAGGGLRDHDELAEVKLVKDVVTIGRAPDCDVVIADNRLVSSHHVQLQRGSAGTVFLSDDSTNGTIVNGVRRVSRGEQFALNSGDIVYLVKKKAHANDDVFFTYHALADLDTTNSTLSYSPDIRPGDRSRSATPTGDEQPPNPVVTVAETLEVEDNAIDAEADGASESARPRVRRVRDQIKEDMSVSSSMQHPHTSRSDTGRLSSTESAKKRASTGEPDADSEAKRSKNSEECDADASCPNDSSKHSADDDAACSSKSSMAQMLVCSICCDIIHDCASLSPCNHKFCCGCYSDWMKKSSECPVCRVRVTSISRDHQFNAVITAYIEEHPDVKRNASETAELDAKNTIKRDVVQLSKRSKKRKKRDCACACDDDDDGHSSADENDETSEEEDEDDDDEIEDESSSENSDLDGYDRQSGRFVCRQCPGVGGNVGFTCVPNQNHFLCQCCLQPVPSRTPVAGQQLPSTQCTHCRRKFCHLYWTCTGRQCRRVGGCLNAFKDTEFADDTMRSLLNQGNQYESTVLWNYLRSSAVNLTTTDFFGLCVTRLRNGQFGLSDATVTPDTPLCRACATAYFAELAYQYRCEIPQAQLPDDVTRRTDCWWGRNCRTQRCKPDHARRLNHICEQTRQS